MFRRMGKGGVGRQWKQETERRRAFLFIRY
jgi:hypothetical protein